MYTKRLLMRLRLYLTIYIVALCFTNGYAYNETSYLYNQTSINEGLSNYRVTSIIDDSHETLWVGTRNGLNRIIGESIKNYRHIPTDSLSIANNDIINILNDDKNRIWVFCHDGTSIYDPINDNFKAVYHNNERLKLYSACKLPDGILFGGNGVVYKYSYEDESFTVKYKTSGQHRFIVDNIISQNNNYAILSVGKVGILLLDTTTSELSLLFSAKQNIWTKSVFMDSSNRLWIPIFNYGIVVCNLDLNNKELTNIREYTFDDSDMDNCSPMSFIEVDNKIWVGFDGGGIYTYNNESSEFEPINLNKNIYQSPLASIYCLYVDANDKIWAGSVHGGLISIKPSYIKNINAKQDIDASHYSISTIYSDDDDNRIWIGFDSGGISIYNSEDESIKEIDAAARLKVTSITKYSNEELIFAAYDNGVYKLNTKTLKITPFHIENQTLHNELFAQQQIVYLSNNNNKIQLFTSSKIFLINGDNISPINWELSDLNYQLIPFGYRGESNYATVGNRVICLDDNSVISVNEHNIQSAALTRDGRIFFCDKDGLKEVVNGQSQLRYKLFDPIISMIADNKDCIWLSSSNQIYCYDLKEKSINFLDRSDGVAKSAYSKCAIYTDANSNIYFGGINALSMIKSNVIFPPTQPQKLSILSLNIDNANIADLTNLHLPHNFTSAKIDFATQNRDIQSNSDAFFTLEGNNNSIEIDVTKNTLIIYSLPAGEYRLLYSYLNKDGLGHNEIEVLNFTVDKPWWLSIYMLFAIIILIIATLYYVGYYKSNKRENELRWVLNEKEKKLSEDRARFLINISHELRTPLTLIYAPLKSIVTNPELPKKLSEGETDKLQKIFNQVRNMFQLVNLVLDTRSMGINGCRLNLESQEFNSWVYSLCNEFELIIENKGLSINYNLSDKIKNVRYDVDKCKVALSNFVMNAIKYGEQRGSITIKTEIIDDKIRVSVSDCGNGISADKIDKIFNRYYQGNATNDGYGIGLSYTKMLIELQGGTVGGYNNHDQGATFFFEIPLHNPTKQSLNRIITTDTPMTNSGDVDSILDSNIDNSPIYMSALIIDDEREIIKLIGDAISPYFKKIHSATDGKQGILKAKQLQPDIIISDIMMPIADGYELCREIKTDENTLHIPVILLSARADTPSTEFGYQVGADNYIPKPFDTDVLKSIVLSTLRNKESLKQRICSVNLKSPQINTTLCNADEEFILKLNSYIDNNITNEDLNLSEIAKHMRMSKSLLHNKMKDVLGTNISTYVNNIRVEKAKILLLNNNLSISDIAYEVGFSSQAYFSTVFKKYEGVSPFVYRTMLEREHQR